MMDHNILQNNWPGRQIHAGGIKLHYTYYLSLGLTAKYMQEGNCSIQSTIIIKRSMT